jgi:hypothetical protein
MEVELLAIFGEQFSEEEAVVEIVFEVVDAFGELDFVVEPIQQKVAHVVTQIQLIINIRRGQRHQLFGGSSERTWVRVVKMDVKARRSQLGLAEGELSLVEDNNSNWFSSMHRL